MNHEVTIHQGNAITPYEMVDRQRFNTEFAARLCGFLSVMDEPYRYWSTKTLSQQAPYEGLFFGHLAFNRH